MINKKDKIEMLIKQIKSIYIKNGFIEPFDGMAGPFKKIFDYEYTYGFDDNGVETYFALRNEDGEGFIFFKYAIKENGAYLVKYDIFTTSKFDKVNSFLLEVLNLSKLRTFVIERLHNEGEAYKYSYNRVLSNILFYSNFRKPIKAKVMGLMAFNYCFDNTFFDGNIGYEGENVNLTISKYIVDNIEKLVKRRVDFSTIN